MSNVAIFCAYKKTAFFNRKEFELSESDYIKLKEKAQNYGVSVTDILLTIYAMILAKLVDCLEKCLIYGHIRRFAD